MKSKVIDSWWSLNHTIPSETKAQALVAIEQELSRLPVDQLPRSELVAIAEGIRDRIYRPVDQAQQRAREEEDRKRNHARQRTVLWTKCLEIARTRTKRTRTRVETRPARDMPRSFVRNQLAGSLLLVQIGGPQPPISNMLSFGVDLI